MIYHEENETGKRLIIKFGKIKLKLKLNNLIFKFSPIVKLIDFFSPKNKRKIIFISTPDFSDNAKIFYEYIRDFQKDEFETVWIYRKHLNKEQLANLNAIFPCPKYNWSSLKGIFHLLTAGYHVITHADTMYSKLISMKKHIVINLWHGMPIKTLGYNEKTIAPSLFKTYKNLGQNAFFFVTSDIFKLSMIACFLIPDKKIFITGQPRTDSIFSTANSGLIESFLNFSRYEKVVLYTPTYKEIARTKDRKKELNKDFLNIFYLDDYDREDFANYLKENNILLVIKPHPFDEQAFKEFYEANPLVSDNIKIIYNDDLLNRNLYFYELFQYSDLMITDFSSIAIDYLITGKPILYLDNFTEEYKSDRGMILEDNFSILISGPKIKTYSDLKYYITESLSNDSYKEDRLKTVPLLHKYTDNKSSERIYNILKKL